MATLKQKLSSERKYHCSSSIS